MKELKIGAMKAVAGSFTKDAAAKDTAETGEAGTVIYSWIGTKEICDRDGDIVKVSGIDTADFEKNPIILFNHNRDIPIAKAVKVYKTDDSLMLDVEFSKSDWGQYVKGLVD